MDGLLPNIPEWWLLVLAVVAVIATGVLVAAESALGKIGHSALAELQEAERPRADAVARLAEESDVAEPGLTLARTLTEMTAAVALTLVVADLLGTWWQVLLVATAVAVVLLAAIAGSGPRRIGAKHPGRVLHALLPGIRAVLVLTRPAVAVGHYLSPRNGRTEAEAREEAAEDLRDMVDRVSRSDHLDAEERTMIRSIFELGSTLVREVMVPRPDMVTMDADKPLNKALALFVRSGFSRVPVIGESVDDVRGVLFLKDVTRRLHMQPEAGSDTVESSAREVAFVPETQLVDDLLRQMQTDNVHIALVVDEYGGIAGLVTIEDLIEELVGELTDEHDRAEPEVEYLADGLVRVPARLPIDELGEIFGLELDDDDVDSAGGLLAKALGKVPIPGAEIEVDGLHMRAERSRGRRRQIATIIARAVTPPAHDEETA
ncbi:hemolysin family protein [Georgenia sp. MJ170]|uniref:hemolysin family protein n=1 Tax=Georgenia sunbinii TaxID=3117728 RepID=UPI002F260F74